MSELKTHDSSITPDKEVITIKDFVLTCLRYWGWILSSVIIFIIAGVLYIKCQEPVYMRSEEILIKDQEAGGGVGGMSSTFASMGLISGKTNVYNELITITSPSVLGEVIDRLQLDVNYMKKGKFHGTDLFGTNLPFKVKFLDLTTEESADFSCRFYPDGNISLYKFISYSQDGDKIKYSDNINDVKIGDTIKTPVGKIAFLSNPIYNPDKVGVESKQVWEIRISKTDIQTTIETYSDKIKGDLKEEFADIIELVIKDVSVERAVAVLEEIVKVYNENWIIDKNRIAKATSSFIEERLRIIESELGEVDSNIAKYRSTTGTIHLTEKNAALIEKESSLENEIVSLTNTLTLCRDMYAYLKDASNKLKIIPINTGAQSEEVEMQINTYNEMLLNRNSLENSSSANNPLVKDYDVQLDNLRDAILKGMSNHILRLDNLLSSAKKEKSKAESTMLESPNKILPLLSEQRQQSVKENLYLYLLEKREENELSQKFTADNIRVITPPMGSLRPVSPKKLLILAFMVFLGFLIPILIIYIIKTGDTKVRSKKDLNYVKAPFAGEIPGVEKSKKRRLFDSLSKIKHPKEDKVPLSVVEEGKRDVVNEAFRVLRSNLDFMTGGKPGQKGDVILLTSFNPGSGKSFISYNLGLSFALKKKKVLLIDCDLRHGSSSMYVGMPKKGITDYLRHSEEDWPTLVKSSSSHPAIDILPVGKIPPNPVELLENGQLEKIVTEAREMYDIIILDCPPVNIVVDTHIVSQCADRTLFVVRAGLLEKSAINELNEFYVEKKFKNMGVILNGTSAVHSRYYTYGTYQNFNK